MVCAFGVDETVVQITGREGLSGTSVVRNMSITFVKRYLIYTSEVFRPCLAAIIHWRFSFPPVPFLKGI
jgi:hypothetical protein